MGCISSPDQIIGQAPREFDFGKIISMQTTDQSIHVDSFNIHVDSFNIHVDAGMGSGVDSL
jgi:hypothetical protein